MSLLLICFNLHTLRELIFIASIFLVKLIRVDHGRLKFCIAIIDVQKQLLWPHKCCGIWICMCKFDSWIFIWDN